MQPFERQPLPEPGLLSRLLGRPRRANAPLEVENLLADAKRATDVPPEAVAEIAAHHGVALARRYRMELGVLYRRFLQHCLVDHVVSGEESRDLAHLKQILGLRDRDVARIHEEASVAAYGKAVEEVLADQTVDAEEREFMSRLQQELSLPTELAEGIYAKRARSILQKFLDGAIADEALAPDEERELETLAANLGAELGVDEATHRELEKLRLFWLIREGEVPAVDVPIRLQRGESCYFTAPAAWHELRTETRRFRYGGPTARLRIAKGIYWRMGDLGVRRVTEDVMRRLDEGQLYLTSKRLIFTGEKKSRSIPLRRILEFEGFRNGVEIRKDRGRSPFLEFDRDPDVFCRLLDRALDDAVG